MAGAGGDDAIAGLTANDLALGGPVDCSCGARLVEVLGDTYIVVDDHRRPYRRRTDYLVCDRCGNLYPVQVLRRVCVAGA